MIEARLSKIDSKPGERSKKLDGAVDLPEDRRERVQTCMKNEEEKKGVSGRWAFSTPRTPVRKPGPSDALTMMTLQKK